MSYIAAIPVAGISDAPSGWDARGFAMAVARDLGLCAETREVLLGADEDDLEALARGMETGNAFRRATRERVDAFVRGRSAAIARGM